MSDVETGGRDPAPSERLIVDLILSQDFPGKEGLVRQVEAARVKTLDEDGSFGFLPSAVPPQPVTQSVPLEAYYTDVDGGTVHAVMHLDKHGRLREVEIFREDGERVIGPPTAEKLKLY